MRHFVTKAVACQQPFRANSVKSDNVQSTIIYFAYSPKIICTSHKFGVIEGEYVSFKSPEYYRVHGRSITMTNLRTYTACSC